MTTRYTAVVKFTHQSKPTWLMREIRVPEKPSSGDHIRIHKRTYCVDYVEMVDGRDGVTVVMRNENSNYKLDEASFDHFIERMLVVGWQRMTGKETTS